MTDAGGSVAGMVSGFVTVDVSTDVVVGIITLLGLAGLAVAVKVGVIGELKILGIVAGIDEVWGWFGVSVDVKVVCAGGNVVVIGVFFRVRIGRVWVGLTRVCGLFAVIALDWRVVGNL